MKTKILLLSFLIIVFSFNLYSQEKISLKKITNFEYYPDYLPHLELIPNTEFYTITEYVPFGNQYLIKYSFSTGKPVDTIANLMKLVGKYIYGYEFSNDGQKILCHTKPTRIYRHSYKAKFYIVDLKTHKVREVDTGLIQVPSFSPDGNKVIYCKDNNLYIKDLTTNDTKQITSDGQWNKIRNGLPDWVYEEEFSTLSAYDWSADSKYIAYIKFNEERVKEYNLIFYGGEKPHYSQYEIYPGLYSYKYPKAGEDNSIVSVHIYDLQNDKTYTVDIGKETDIYIPRIKWLPYENTLAIFRLNRLQNQMDILFYSLKDNQTKLIYTEKEDKYIDEKIFGDTFNPNAKINFEFISKKYFVMTAELDNYNHLYLFSTKGELIRDLTPGKFDVITYYGYDPDTKTFFVQAAKESPLQREIYSVSFNGKMKKLSQRSGTNEAIFSSNFKYFINTYSNAITPNYITINSAKTGKELHVLIDNETLKQEIERLGGINKKFIKIKIKSNLYLNAYLLYPPDFDSTKKYPLIISQYNGPGVQTVLDEWQFGWENYMAQKGFIIASVDTRGTGARGEKFKKVTYKKLGKYETKDLLATARYLKSLPYVDGENMGIWGWSYGGFMVLNVLTSDTIFKAGVAIAPVSNWRYYDNIYTERYMRRPKDNPEGYKSTAPLYRADKLSGNLLICTGLTDDNVHPQNTFEFVEKLVQANIPFQMYTFTNRNHSIYGGNTRYFLYQRFTEFFIKHLKENK